jgi:hypothetical protein
LVLGIAGGEDRGRALDHAALCMRCRRFVDEHAETADDLLLLMPSHEPPLGFESRVLRELRRRRGEPRATVAGRLRKLPRRLKAGAALVAVAALTASVMLLTFRDDRRLASHYTDALAQGQGKFFGSAALLDGQGRRAGDVFEYRGSPSWMVITLAPKHQSGGWGCQVVTRDGRRIKAGWWKAERRNPSWATTIPVDLREVRQVRVVSHEGTVLSASVKAQ